MDVYYCGQCRMMIAPQARYCSVCGSVVHAKVSRWRKAWSHSVHIAQRVVAIYVVWVALRVGFPIALVVTPMCDTTPATIGFAPRQLGTVQSYVGLVGGEPLVVARPCPPVPTWYLSMPAHPWLVALVDRDTTTWQGWVLAMLDDGITAGEQAVIAAVQVSMRAVRGFLFEVHTW